MGSLFGKLGLRSLFLLLLGLNGSYCFKLFWWGAEPEKVSTEPQYGECDWARPTTTAQLQAAASGTGNAYNNAGYNAANTGYNNAQNTGYNNAQDTGYNNAQNTGYNNAQNTGYNNAQNTGYNNAQNTGYNAAAGNGYVNPGGYNSPAYDTQSTGYGKSGNNDGVVPDSLIPISAGGNSILFYHEDDLVASHPTLPIGSYASVTNPNNEKFVVVRIIEQRPCVVGRILTMSSAAFKQIADLDQSVIPCYVSTT